jgi:plastocyanin
MRTALAAIVVAMWAAGCGGGSSDGGGTGGGTCTPGMTATVTERSTGFSPKAVCVRPTGTVTFTNADTSDHTVEFSTASCTSLNPGLIAAGTSKPVTFPTVTTCAFSDTGHSTDAAFQGTVAVSSGTTTGPGY